MFTVLKNYLHRNLLKGLMTSPFQGPLKAWALVPVYGVLALLLGLGTGLFHLDPIMMGWAPLLLVGLLLSPSLIEEALFRGLMIPRQIQQSGSVWVGLATGWSTILYVLWHPLSALTTRPEAQPYFLDPAFLTIVALLGITCGHNYVLTKSLWGPILIHWATVVIWVFLLGGHELVLGAD